jgi:succinate dehydrogenase / fumarate reductase cytochrome b subunit
MSQALRSPRAYHRGTWELFIEGFRYDGGIGQWSWVLHRVTGLGVLLFLIIHVIDTFLVVAFPAEYDWTVAIYGGVISGVYYGPLRWGFRFAELGLIASVVFHATNGVRIVIFDFWPKAAAIQRQLFWAVLVVFLLIMIPVAIWVLSALASAPAHITV